MRKFLLIGFVFVFLALPNYGVAVASVEAVPKAIDSDSDGLDDTTEVQVYNTDPNNPDTDEDGYLDGNEVRYSFNPNVSAPGDRLSKYIEVNIKKQELTYSLGPYPIKTIKISTGVRAHPTPKGTFSILKKIPVHLYKGKDYYYPNTRWNMQFLPSAAGSYYIHGAYWHNNFGTPMSHGCVNVSYADIESLYNWADIGTKLTIK